MRNGGHSFEGNSAQNGTVVLDISGMSKIAIAADNATATVQAGALLGPLYYKAFYSAGRGVNAGTCPPVGVSGLLLGGGYGYWSRANGLSCDNVASFSMLTWEGKLLSNVTATGPHADLFWASCGGGGGNFGVVLSWTIRLFVLPPAVQYSSLKFANDTATSVAVWNFYQSWAPTADPGLGMGLNYGSGNSGVRIFMYYTGAKDLRQIVEASGILDSADAPPTQAYSRISYIRAVVQGTGWGLSSPEDLLKTDWSAFRVARVENSLYVLKPMRESLIKQMYDLWEQYPSAAIKFHPYGGQIARRGPTGTAFPWRSALGLIQITAPWDDGNAAQEAQARRWVADISDLLASGMSDAQPRAAYVNYLYGDLQGWEGAYFGGNYKKLQGVKAKYDPQNFFRFSQSIAPPKPAPCKYKPC